MRATKTGRFCSIQNACLKVLSFALAAFLLTGCSGMGEQFAEGLRVMSGKGGTKEQVDTFPALKAQAAAIAKSYPKPRWQKVFHADAADIFALLPENRLLLGEVNVSTAIAEPELGALSAYDLATGEKLWTFQRKDLEWGRYELLSVQPAILLQAISPKGGSYTALDPKTGQVLWDYPLKATTRSTYDDTNRKIFLLDGGEQGSELRALDVKSGKVAWRQTLGSIGRDARVSLVSSGGYVYVLTGSLHKLSGKDGAIVWQQPLAAYFDNLQELNLRPTRYGVLLWDWRRLSLVDSGTGTTLWGPVYPTEPRAGQRPSYEGIKVLSVPVTGEGVFFSTTRRNIYKVDLRSGEKRWRYALDKKDGSSLQSPFFLSSNKLYFTTYNSITILDAVRGVRKERMTIPFLESGLFSAMTPDFFIERGDKTFMLREGGAVYALSKQTDKLLWKQILDWNYEMSFNTTQIDKSLKKVLTDKAVSEKEVRDSARWWASWTSAVDYQWRGYTYPGSVNDQGLGSFGSSMALFQSMLGLSESIELSMKAAATEGLAERLNMELNNAAKNHMRSVQQGYFIRPYDSARGTLVMLVQLDSGKRYDLVYSPVNVGMKLIDMRLPAFLIDPSGTSLYTTGVGIIPERYERYVKFKAGMPYPSVLRYSLKDMRFTRD